MVHDIADIKRLNEEAVLRAATERRLRQADAVAAEWRGAAALEQRIEVLVDQLVREKLAAIFRDLLRD